MNQDLVNSIRKNRELKVEVGLPGGKTFTVLCRRPTDVEADRLASLRTDDSEIARDFVIGWNGILEDDIVQNGSTDPVEFDRAVWAEWCADLGPVYQKLPDGSKLKQAKVVYTGVWEPIASACINAWKARGDALRDAAKK